MKKRDERERRMKFIIGIMISVFMVSSAASVVFFYRAPSSDKFTLTYDIDYTFFRRQDNQGNLYYEVTSDKGSFIAFTLPTQLSYLNTDLSIIDTPFFYLTFNPNSSELTNIDYLRFDLRNNIPSNKFFQDSVTQPSTTYNLPIISCQNASLHAPVVLLQNDTELNITVKDNCVHINFAPYDVLRIRDFLVYTLNGIDINA